MRQELIWRGVQVIEKMERETGFEPATSSLGSWHSTTELLPLNRQLKYRTNSNLRATPKSASLRIRDSTSFNHAVIGFNSLDGIFIWLALKMDSKSTISPVG